MLSWLCASLPRMCERTSQNRSPGHWLLALSLAWLWTLLASASLQPPTPTGLGQVTEPGGGFSWRPGELDTAPHHSRAGRSPRPGKMWILGFLAPFLFFTQENLPPLCHPSPEKVWADLWFPFVPGQTMFCRERGSGEEA